MDGVPAAGVVPGAGGRGRGEQRGRGRNDAHDALPAGVPVAAGRILKYIACVAYTFALTAFYGGVGIGWQGLLYEGIGGLFAFRALREPLSRCMNRGRGLWRYLGALPLLALCLTSFASLGFLFSCLNMKPAAATVVTLTIFFFDFIFRNIPYFESLKPYFLTGHMTAWLGMFAPPHRTGGGSPVTWLISSPWTRRLCVLGTRDVYPAGLQGVTRSLPVSGYGWQNRTPAGGPARRRPHGRSDSAAARAVGRPLPNGGRRAKLAGRSNRR